MPGSPQRSRRWGLRAWFERRRRGLVIVGVGIKTADGAALVLLAALVAAVLALVLGSPTFRTGIAAA